MVVKTSAKMLLIWKSSFRGSVSRTHPWTPMRKETMEQSNLGSKPPKLADTWRSQSHLPTHCWRTCPPILHGLVPHLEVSMLAWHPGGPAGMGQEMSIEKDLRKFWKNPPQSHLYMKCRWEDGMLGNKYIWVFAKNLNILNLYKNLTGSLCVWDAKVVFHSEYLCSLAKFQ